MKLIRILPLLAATMLLGACASMLNGKYQPVTVVPVGGDFENDQCTLSNSKGNWVRVPGKETLVLRASGPLQVECEGEQHRGTATVDSKTQWRYYWANFLIWDLCTISCIVDMSTGALFDYPTVIQVPMALTDKEVADVPAKIVAPRQASAEAIQSAMSTTASTSERAAPQPAVDTPEIARAEARSFAFDEAQAIVQARNCAGLSLESQSESGAMYSMYCATGRELLLCSSAGCRVAD